MNILIETIAQMMLKNKLINDYIYRNQFYKNYLKGFVDELLKDITVDYLITVKQPFIIYIKKSDILETKGLFLKIWNSEFNKLLYKTFKIKIRLKYISTPRFYNLKFTNIFYKSLLTK